MTLQDRINAMFPAQDSIPAEFRLEAAVDQNEYLVNGELRHWDGPMREVLSPVWVRTPAGLAPKLIGRYPLLTEKQSLEALDAAAKAYDHGRGLWPTLPVSERIKHVQEFAYRMKEQKRQVVNLAPSSQCFRLMI